MQPKPNLDEREIIKTDLRALFPKGSTVYVVIRHIAKSGATFYIDPIKIDGTIVTHPRHNVGRLLDLSSDKHEAVRVVGGGMDMGYKLIYDLGRALYGDGYALNKVQL